MQSAGIVTVPALSVTHMCIIMPRKAIVDPPAASCLIDLPEHINIIAVCITPSPIERAQLRRMHLRTARI